MAICKLPSCNTEQKYLSLGLCRKHHFRYKKWGNPEHDRFTARKAVVEGGVTKIPVGKNAKHGYVLVDKEYAWLDKYCWTLASGGYAIGTVDGKLTLMHKLILAGKGQVDHRNMDGLDNRRTNLRLCTDGENKRNREKYANNTSGYKGVELLKNGRFRAVIVRERKRYNAGCYSSAIEAAKAYNNKATELFGEFVRLNVI